MWHVYNVRYIKKDFEWDVFIITDIFFSIEPSFLIKSMMTFILRNFWFCKEKLIKVGKELPQGIWRFNGVHYKTILLVIIA